MVPEITPAQPRVFHPTNVHALYMYFDFDLVHCVSRILTQARPQDALHRTSNRSWAYNTYYTVHVTAWDGWTTSYNDYYKK